MKGVLEKLGSTGALAAAAACPLCFPKLALIGALLGLGGLGAYESQLFMATQVLVVLAVAWHVVSFRRHRQRWLLAAALISAAAMFAGLYFLGSEVAIYAGFAGLVAASLPELWALAREHLERPKHTSIITCTGCGLVLRPRRGDCCVYCSYGTVKCPSMQTA